MTATTTRRKSSFIQIKEIAKVCNVSEKTVNRWIDRKYLIGSKLPMGRHRRVLLTDFTEFVKTYSHLLPAEAVTQYSKE